MPSGRRCLNSALKHLTLGLNPFHFLPTETILNTDLSAGRLASIDMLRGLVMVLMALDHTRDFFSIAHFKPTDLEQTTTALFLTRWITHYCAPVFVFLAGASAYLWADKKGPDAPISAFLFKRGLLLLVLTCTVEAWSWNFRNDFRHIDGGVLWAIGWSMVALAGLVKLPLPWLTGFGALIVAGHNAFDHVKPADLGAFGPWWAILHTGDDVPLTENWLINPYYPLLPWIGVMALGYGFGYWLSRPDWRTRKRLFGIGLLLTGLFIGLRLSNLYGDPDPWQVQPDAAFSLLSFLNCHKYPPSLLYLLMTLGPALIFLAWAENKAPPKQHPLLLFGRTPLIYYLLHLYLIHLLALALAAVSGGPVSALVGGGIWSKDLPADYGYGLPVVYLIWLCVVAALYPVCRNFERLKANNPHWRWLTYL